MNIGIMPMILKCLPFIKLDQNKVKFNIYGGKGQEYKKNFWIWRKS